MQIGSGRPGILIQSFDLMRQIPERATTRPAGLPHRANAPQGRPVLPASRGQRVVGGVATATQELLSDGRHARLGVAVDGAVRTRRTPWRSAPRVFVHPVAFPGGPTP